MKEIKDAIFQRLQSDSALKGITGWSESDPRVYAAYPPQKVNLSNAQPACLTVAFDGLGEPAGPDGATLPDEAYRIEIRAISSSVVESVYSAIHRLMTDWNFETNSYRGMQVKFLDAGDGFSQTGSIYIRTARCLVSHILKAV